MEQMWTAYGPPRTKGTDMRVSQDLCIALVFAVIGIGLGKPSLARSEAEEGLAIVEQAMAEEGLSQEKKISVRKLIAHARERERAGDADGAASAMAEASAILRIS